MEKWFRPPCRNCSGWPKTKAAWFRLLEGGHMVASHAVGVSPDFLRDVSFVEVTEDLTKMLELARPRVARADSAGPESPERLKVEKVRQVVMLPVVGKKSPVGLLLLGSSRNIQCTKEESEFIHSGE